MRVLCVVVRVLRVCVVHVLRVCVGWAFCVCGVGLCVELCVLRVWRDLESKRLRVSVQNASECAGKTRAC